MQRLMAIAARRTRPRDERGVTAVLVGLLVVVLVGFGALAVDVGNLWVARKQLQNGADAAALAIAQACATNLSSPACASGNATATDYAKQNKLGADASHTSGVVVSITRANPGSVSVRTTSTEPSFLAGVLGITSSAVGATATAAWGGGSPSSLTTLPLIIGDCYLRRTTGGRPPSGTLVTFKLINSAKGKDSTCGSDQPENPAGGFGWLVVSNGSCELSTVVDEDVPSQTGKPAKCGDAGEMLGGPGSILELPLFDYSVDQGSNGAYHVIGYVAVQLNSYCIDQKQLNADGTIGNCDQGKQWIEGTIVAYPDSSGEFLGGGGDNYGITTVTLTQ